MESIFDLSNPQSKRTLMTFIGALQGPHRVEVVKFRPSRTNRQLRYYFPCLVKPFLEYRLEQGEQETLLTCHALLKNEFLKRSMVDKNGEILGEYVPRTEDLDTAEFAKYVDNCAMWLAKTLNIIVAEANPHWKEVEEENKRKTILSQPSGSLTTAARE